MTNTVLLYLNCNQVLAGPGGAGNSAASPEGQQAKRDQEAYEWKSTTEDGAQWCAENQKAHPDWGPQHSMAAPAPDRLLMALNFCRKIMDEKMSALPTCGLLRL